ncbi:hypothetical protein AHAS_Ahas15G0313600 [Arachis hypogaea]
MSRCDTILFGDKNSKYFHLKADGKRKKNGITALKSEDRDWVEDVKMLKNWGVNFFKTLYCSNFVSNSFVDLHIPYLEIESDPSCAINLVQNTAVATHVGTSLVRSIKELLIKPQKVVIRLIFKEANQCVDALTKYGQGMEKRVMLFKEVPAIMVLLMKTDERGGEFCRTTLV